MGQSEETKMALLCKDVDDLKKCLTEIKPIFWDNNKKVEKMEDFVKEIKNDRQQTKKDRINDRRMLMGVLLTALAALAVMLIKELL